MEIMCFYAVILEFRISCAITSLLIMRMLLLLSFFVVVVRTLKTDKRSVDKSNESACVCVYVQADQKQMDGRADKQQIVCCTRCLLFYACTRM